MNRREFLKFMGVGAIAAAMPGTVVAELVKSAEPEIRGEIGRIDGFRFIESESYGDYVAVSDPENWDNPEFRARIFHALEENMRNVIPPTHWHKVKYIEHGFGTTGTVDPFNEVATIAWRYRP